MGRCLLHAQCIDLCFVATDTRVKRVGSATDANVNMERNPKDSVVCGVKVYAQGAPVEPPMQPAEVPFCSVSVVCSLFVHHMFPSSNCGVHAQVLSSHGGRLLPFHGWVSGGGSQC